MSHQTITIPTNDYLMNFVSCAAVFTPEECHRLIEWPYSHQKYGETMTSGANAQRVQDFSIRYTLTKYIEPDPTNNWIFERVKRVVDSINRQYFKFILSGFPNLQILEYPVGGFYRTHTDLGSGAYSTRKLSVIFLLSDPSAFEGGELTGTNGENILTSQGMAVIFPAYLPHQVKPVTAGLRHTMVTWVLGPPYQ